MAIFDPIVAALSGGGNNKPVSSAPSADPSDTKTTKLTPDDIKAAQARRAENTAELAKEGKDEFGKPLASKKGNKTKSKTKMQTLYNKTPSMRLDN